MLPDIQFKKLLIKIYFLFKASLQYGDLDVGTLAVVLLLSNISLDKMIDIEKYLFKSEILDNCASKVISM